jgi:hypothetical protein
LKNKGIISLLLLACIVLFASCQSVKPYQRVYLNDHFMKMEVRKAGNFGEKVHAYREGAIGGGTGKFSGGCGCN